MGFLNVSNMAILSWIILYCGWLSYAWSFISLYLLDFSSAVHLPRRQPKMFPGIAKCHLWVKNCSWLKTIGLWASLYKSSTITYILTCYILNIPIFSLSCLVLVICTIIKTLGLPVGTSGKEPACQCRRQEAWFDPWVGKIPWRQAWQPTPVSLPKESHGQSSLQTTVHGVAKSQTRLKWLNMYILQDFTNSEISFFQDYCICMHNWFIQITIQTKLQIALKCCF